MSPEREWELSKPKILKHLEAGWSVTVAFKKARISKPSPVYDLYQRDTEFKESIKQYHKPRTTSWYDKLTAVPRVFINSKINPAD